MTDRPTKNAARPKWHLAYYALALIDILTILLALYLSHSIMAIYEESVERNQQISQRINDLTKLSHIISEVNTPGNRVFDSLAIDKERRLLKENQLWFQTAFENSRANLEQTFDTAILGTLLQHSDELNDQVRSISEHALSIFQALDNNDHQAAGQQMAQMDQTYFMAHHTISEMSQLIAAYQKKEFERQLDLARELKQYELLISFAVLLIVALVSFYGHFLGRRMTSDENKLTQALQASQASEQAKTTFLANMSHEIRTPMNGVLGILNILNKRLREPSNRHFVELANTSANSLLTVINDILSFSKLEAGELTLAKKPFNVIDLIGEQAELMVFLAEEKKLQLILDLKDIHHPNLLGDQDRVKQLLNNLVGNAIKFTDHGHVLIKAATKKNEEGIYTLQCNIIDTGIGIPKENLPTLFEQFTQVDDGSNRRYGGTGLGLAISKRLCEMMDGDISVTSEPGKGSDFCFNIRLSCDPADTGSQRLLDFSGCTLVIAGSYEPQLQTLKQTVVALGGAVHVVERSFDLQAALESESADILIVDYDLPGLQLQQLMSQIRDGLTLATMVTMAQLPDVANQSTTSRLVAIPKPITYRDLALVLDAHRAPQSKSQLQSPAQQALHTMQSSETRGISQLRILVAEDNAINQFVVSGVLEDAHCHFDIAENGEEVLRLLAANPAYDVILMDCQMPVMDGYDTTRKIRAGDSGNSQKDIYIVALTANAMEDDEALCLASGMDAYLSKPLEEEQLVQLLDRYCQVEPEQRKRSNES